MILQHVKHLHGEKEAIVQHQTSHCRPSLSSWLQHIAVRMMLLANLYMQCIRGPFYKCHGSELGKLRWSPCLHDAMQMG